MLANRKCTSPAVGSTVVQQNVVKPSAQLRTSKTNVPKHVCNAMDQAQEMKNAEKRWEQSIQEGRVRNVSSAEANDLMQQGWVLLDVRPPSEFSKVPIKDAVNIPLFIEDDAMDISSLLKQMSAFGMGGWWLGGTHMVSNNQFMRQVQEKIPRDASIIVACQKGLRSLAASEQLSRAGFTNLAWINGGLDTDRGQLPSANGKDLRYAGIGGLSEVLGWTEVQQEADKGMGDKAGTVIKIAAGILVLDLLVLGYEQLQYMQGQ